MTAYPPTRCFWIEPAGLARLELVRMTFHDRIPCTEERGHHASVYFGTARSTIVDGTHHDVAETFAWPPHDSPLWPTTCEDCDYEFHPSDEWVQRTVTLYQTQTGSWRGRLLDAPPGAMFDAFWYPRKGEDGLSLSVVLPNGNIWCIDSRSSNCGMPNDTKHRCWVRHGLPPMITVDKQGYTCQAGAGSIQSDDFHGFLRNGVLAE